jgi:hypothetical protein
MQQYQVLINYEVVMVAPRVMLMQVATMVGANGKALILYVLTKK